MACGQLNATRRSNLELTQVSRLMLYSSTTRGTQEQEPPVSWQDSISRSLYVIIVAQSDIYVGSVILGASFSSKKVIMQVFFPEHLYNYIYVCIYIYIYIYIS